MQNLCDPRRIKVERDLLEELGRLPRSLSDLYDRIFTEILDSAKHSKSIGIQILSWLRVARRTLTVSEIIGAVALVDDGTFTPLNTRDILGMTCNLVVEDTARDCLRYAHLSVREFLEGRSEFSDDQCHRRLAERCLESYTIYYSLKDPLSEYAMLHWAAHYSALSPVIRNTVMYIHLIPFLFQNDSTSQTFTRWRREIQSKISCRGKYTIEEVYGSNAIYSPSYSSVETHVRVFDQERNVEVALLAASTPFFITCIYGFREVLEVRAKTQAAAFTTDLSATCEVSGSLFKGYNGLHIAAFCRHYHLVEFLLAAGMKSSSCTARGETPLHIAVRRQSPRMVRFLLQHGAEPNAISHLCKAISSSEADMTPKDSLSPTNDREMGTRSSLGFRQIYGGIVSVIDEDAEAPIHLAAREGDKPCLSELLDNGANVNARTTLGSTALHLALVANRVDIVELLLTRGADVNLSITYERTPLHIAAAAGNSHIVALLLQSNANPNKRDHSGRSALGIARMYGHTSIIAQLIPLTDVEPSSTPVHISSMSNQSANLLPRVPIR